MFYDLAMHFKGHRTALWQTGCIGIQRARGMSYVRDSPGPVIVAAKGRSPMRNPLTMAETMMGYKGRTAHAIPLDELKDLFAEE